MHKELLMYRLFCLSLILLSAIILGIGCSLPDDSSIRTEERILVIGDISYPDFEELSRSRTREGSAGDFLYSFINEGDFISQLADEILSMIKSDIAAGEDIRTPHYFTFTNSNLGPGTFTFYFSYMLVDDEETPKILLISDADFEGTPYWTDNCGEIRFEDDFSTLNFFSEVLTEPKDLWALTYHFDTRSGASFQRDLGSHYEIRYDAEEGSLTGIVDADGSIQIMYGTSEGIGYCNPLDLEAPSIEYLTSSGVSTEGTALSNKDTIDTELGILIDELKITDFSDFFERIAVPDFTDDQFTALGAYLEQQHPSNT